MDLKLAWEQVLLKKKVVETGYWHMLRYNLMLKVQEKNPFIQDFKKSILFKEFVEG